jgi:flagellin
LSLVGGDAVPIQIQEQAQEALSKIDEAIVRKDQICAHLGALQNRLKNTVSNLRIQAENLQAAESRISDVDVAIEMTEFARALILVDAARAVPAQANSLPRTALRLIPGFCSLQYRARSC